jgi:hypothetical protein
MQEDAGYEYIAQPNQNRFRFRNQIRYNAQSMRSDEIDSSATLILGFGDSVINGGLQTEQDSLATSILSENLSEMLGEKCQFLNISAESWGPDNCFAYLNEHGHFGAKYIYLFVSSHDAYDVMRFQKVVDIDESYPSSQHVSAIAELFSRYFIPRIVKAVGLKKPSVVEEGDQEFNSGFSSFVDYASANSIPLVIYLHAEIDELKAGSYNEQGEKIIHFADRNGIPIIKDLELDLGSQEFSDYIHVNETGQRNIAHRVLDSFEESVFILDDLDGEVVAR